MVDGQGTAGGALSHAWCFREGLAPIHVAAAAGHASTIELLVKSGADVNAVDK